MARIDDLKEKLLHFRAERDWEQFHNPKDMALSLVLEASEVLEHFQWKNGEKMTDYAKNNKDEIGEELADVLNWLLLLANDLDIDLLEALDKKIDNNAIKYPVKKSKGIAQKYTKL